MKILLDRLIIKPIEEVDVDFDTNQDEYRMKAYDRGIIEGIGDECSMKHYVECGDTVYFDTFGAKYIQEEGYYVVPGKNLMLKE